MPIPFARYLDAKFALDERSLNREVQQVCIDGLKTRNPLRCLDAGTGTGALVRRLLDSGLLSSLTITALDRDEALLAIAARAAVTQLATRGFAVDMAANRIRAEQADRRILIQFQCTGLLDFEPMVEGGYDLITAHSFMDIVPMAPALSCFARWLTPKGVFYATLNYDGDTALYPLYPDEAFETALLQAYDTSMERRRAQGEPTGGARSGRRLHSLLPQAGLEVLAYGSSDWNITPRFGRYRDSDAEVLAALLGMIRDEAERATAINDSQLAQWYRHRRSQLESGQLGMIIHQIDLLARRRPSLP